LKGNFHEQFLEGLAGAIPPGYPAIRKQAARHCALSLPNDASGTLVCVYWIRRAPKKSCGD